MATTTPNFGWAVPTSSDLVKNGATAIETLGDSIDASLVDLKGGTTNQVLAKNSNTDMDFKWVTPAAGGGGKVLQVVTATTSTSTSTNTSTPADTSLTATITPTASTSKILVLVSQGHYFIKSGAQAAAGLRIMRDATQIWTVGTYGWANISVGAASTDGRNYSSVIYLDSPATTSATTYKTQGSTFNTTTVTWQESGPSMITLMEIGA